MNLWPGLIVLACVLASAAIGAAGEEAKVSCVKAPPLGKANAFYVSNKPPLAPSPFVKLPIGAITPRGWLLHMLELKAAGMVGHLPEIAPWCKADGNAWLSPTGEGHSPWEELPYWLKGFGDLGYVLRNDRITAEARKWIEGIIASQRDDGYFGPRANLTHLRGKPDLWPNMIALNALQSFHEATGDPRVPLFMAKYFKWQLSVPDEDFLLPFWQQQRAGDNLESVYWLYNRTGDAELLKLADKIFRRMARWDKGIASYHGVNFAQCFRAPAIYWMQAKDERLRDAAYRNYDTMMGEFGQMPGGLFAADENARKGYTDPRQCGETCTIVEFMHSFQMLTRITGDPLWADRCEEIAFNSFPAAMTPDLKGLHYLTGANQPQLDTRNHAPGIQNSGNMFGYDPHSYRCCQHNVAMGWPYYAQELWLATPDNGLCASLYAACEVEAKVGDGTTVRIDAQATEYPFDEALSFRLSAPKPVRFPLYLRVPRWCKGPKLELNGKPLDAKAEPLSYLVVEREWRDRDHVVLRLPMELSVRVWEKNKNAVSVDFGPLTFSLKIGEEWKRYGGTDKWPAYAVFPTTPWNYGLEVDPQNPNATMRICVVPNAIALQQNKPFAYQNTAIWIEAKARRIPQWGFDRHGLCATLQQSPAYTTEPLETVTLIPMGCARLRISAFPTVSDKPDAHKWQEQPQPGYVASASHCFHGDTTDALCDGLLPRSSNDHSIPRFTWWDHKGTTEWVAYKFPKPRTLSWSDVYWFDDTGRGQCRIPASWKLLYKDGNDWKEVKLADGSLYGFAKDAFNKVAFEPVTTTELRLEAKLQPDFSGGILEWRVGDR